MKKKKKEKKEEERDEPLLNPNSRFTAVCGIFTRDE